MEPETVEQSDQCTSHKDDEIPSKLYSELASELLVAYDLDSLYYEDPEKALGQLMQNLEVDKEKTPFQKRAFIVFNFQTRREKILKKIESVDEDDYEEMIMLLFYIVHSFENMVNQYIYYELKNKDFTKKEETRVVQRLSTADKLGWLLKLICGKEYISNNNWSLLKNFIETRNFYIHYMPDTIEAYDKHHVKLSKESFISFLDHACDCYSFLKECTSKEVTEKSQRVQGLRDFIEVRLQRGKFL